jgi:methylmalonyl-CoA mutase N-terminal domain/subunit
VKFTTVSGEPVDSLSTPREIEETDYLRDIGFPGEFPYTRGIHRSMYRGHLWAMRQFAGFGTPEDSNRENRPRFFLLQAVRRRNNIQRL